MIRRLYVHNFRCLENFELSIAEHSSILLIGRNGSGKSTIRRALEILQDIARGANRVGELLKPKDFSRGQAGVPIRFEVEAILRGLEYKFSISFEVRPNLNSLLVSEEELWIGGKRKYARHKDNVEIGEDVVGFMLDRELIILPILQTESSSDPLFQFKEWLANMVILSPLPSLVTGDSEGDTLHPSVTLQNFGAWFSGLLAHSPAAYVEIDRYLREVMPDFKDVKNPSTSQEHRRISVQFSTTQGSLSLPFADLSDGEKCFIICAVVLAAQKAYGPIVCFWDEPDNYLALSEVGHFVMALRKAFKSGGQFIATSHNPEVIRKFSDENTLLLFRNSHLEPTQVRPISEIQIKGDLIETLILGDELP